MGDPVGHTGFMNCRSRISAADNGGGTMGGCLRQGICDGIGSAGGIFNFKNPHGAVPDNGFGGADYRPELFDRFRSDVEAKFIWRNPICSNLFKVADLAPIEVKSVRNLTVNRKNYFLAALCQQLFSQINFIFFKQGFSDFFTLGFKKGIGHAPADDDVVDPRQQIGNNVNFTGNLGTAQNSHKWFVRIF